jgi:hypothetical protein
MPLKKGKSQKTISANIQTLVDDYQKSGRIGTSKPANKKAAVEQATAIALRMSGKPKKFVTGGLVAGNPPSSSPLVATMTQATGTSSSRSRSSSQPQQQQSQQRKPTYIDFLPGQSGQVEDQFPKFKRTQPRMQWTGDPSSYGETTNEAATMRHLLSGQPPRNTTERNLARSLGMAFKKGGKVTSKKGNKK